MIRTRNPVLNFNQILQYINIYCFIEPKDIPVKHLTAIVKN